ncbi:OmpA family protein [Portibacter lacus]|nr:OmpA family protein [Portibacter lacus]
MKIKLIIPVLLFTLISGLNVNAQSTTTVIENVILFNSKPYKVRMTPKGKILSFINDVDNNYASLNKISASKIEMPSDEVESMTDLARVNGDKLELEKSMIKDISEEEVGEMLAENSVREEDEMNAKGDVKSTDYDYEFAFDHRDATLSPSSVNQLNQIAKILESDENARLEIKSYYSDNVDVSKILSKNRTKSIQEMLVEKGIDQSRINIQESNNEDWANNKVQLSIH